MDYSDKIYIAGHRGMVGAAIKRNLEQKGYSRIIGRTSSELDLRNQDAVYTFFRRERPAYVFMAAAKVGGILANNTFRAQFLSDNLIMACNVIEAAYRYGVKKLLFLGSTCIYPKNCPQPIKEEYLLTGPLEPTNEPYALAKIAGIKMCESYRDQYGSNFISVMPTNLYGKGDNYHPENSHVLPALIRRFHEARTQNSPEVVVWGTGKPRREFLYADDLADACVFLMEEYNEREKINVGTGEDLTIAELAQLISEIVGYKGRIVFDPSKPDGTPRKVTDVSRLHALGWKHKTSLPDGIKIAYEDFLQKN
jgi:Nucleoside-diphosphate-sugar epimerases